MSAKAIQIVENKLRRARFLSEASRASLAVDILVALADIGYGAMDAGPISIREADMPASSE